MASAPLARSTNVLILSRKCAETSGASHGTRLAPVKEPDTERPEISVVLPAFNERQSLPVAVERALDVLPGLVSSYEVVVVDDGSTDGTGEVARSLIEAHYPTVRLAEHEGNRGYGAAIRTGFGQARGELLFYTDADNQFDLSDLEHFMPLIREYDAVVGFRVYRYDSVVRSMLSWIYNLIVRILFRVRVRDVDCAFKLFRREVINAIVIESDDFFVDAELVAKTRRWNFRILEKGVRHYPRVAGETTVRASDIPETLRRIAIMWKRIHFPGRRHLEALAASTAPARSVGDEVLPQRVAVNE
jgi:glycosyltransferase involved in cell wall biosynthesis